MDKLLTKTGSTAREQTMMYKAVVQKVLLYRSESWVVKVSMLKLLEEFHNQVSHRIPRMSYHQVGGKEWRW